MRERIIVIGHKSPDTDSVVAAIAYADFKGKIDLDDDYVPARAGDLNPETEYVLKRFNIKTPELVSSVAGKKVILVDHNEMGQVVNGTGEATTLEIIDHHKIGGLQTSSPILFHAEPIGSTCTIVADFFFYHNIKLSKEMASILLAGILSDTIVFKSPTTTDKDKRIAERLNETAKLDIQSFGLDVKKSKSSIKGLSANDLIMGDFKEFEKKGFKYGIGQIEVVHYEEALSRKKELMAELKSVCEAKGLKMALFMVTNIIEESTRLWFSGNEDVIKKAFKLPAKDSEVYLKGVMSRKKQVVPPIEESI